jgi:hypothetical protein
MEAVLICIGILLIVYSIWLVISRLFRVKKSDKITFVKGDKSITVSSNPSKEDILKLYNF